MPLLLMGLLMELFRHYIAESWKRIIVNITTHVNTPTELKMVLC